MASAASWRDAPARAADWAWDAIILAALDHGDGQRDQLLGPRVERPGGEGRLVQLAEPAVDVGHRAS